MEIWLIPRHTTLVSTFSSSFYFPSRPTNIRSLRPNFLSSATTTKPIQQPEKKSQNPETFYQSPGSATQPLQFLLTIPTSHGKPSTSHQLARQPARQPAQCTIRPSRKPSSILFVVCQLSPSILYLLGYRHRQRSLPGEWRSPQEGAGGVLFRSLFFHGLIDTTGILILGRGTQMERDGRTGSGIRSRMHHTYPGGEGRHIWIFLLACGHGMI